MVEEAALVRAEDDREEDSEGFAVLLRDEVEVVREGTGARVGGCEVEGSLGFGAGLVAVSPSSFSSALTFRVRESTWKLSFLRSLSTLELEGGQNTSKERKHQRSQQVFVVSPLNFCTFLLQILFHLVVSFLQFLQARLQTRFRAECVELALQCGQSFLMLRILERELQLDTRRLLLQRGIIFPQCSQPTSKVRNLGFPVISDERTILGVKIEVLTVP